MRSTFVHRQCMLHMCMRRADSFRAHRSGFSTASKTGLRASQFAVESDLASDREGGKCRKRAFAQRSSLSKSAQSVYKST